MTKAFASYLRTYRRRYGLTQAELGCLLGYRTGTVVSRLEQNRGRPSAEAIHALDIIFGAASADLFPELHATTGRQVLERARLLYDDLQGDGSQTTRLKLDFLESIFDRAERPRPDRL